jgi:hypothetical protein
MLTLGGTLLLVAQEDISLVFHDLSKLREKSGLLIEETQDLILLHEIALERE